MSLHGCDKGSASLHASRSWGRDGGVNFDEHVVTRNSERTASMQISSFHSRLAETTLVVFHVCLCLLCSGSAAGSLERGSGVSAFRALFGG